MDASHATTRIREKTRFARIWPSASKIGIFLRVDSRESAKRWCANRLPTKLGGCGHRDVPQMSLDQPSSMRVAKEQELRSNGLGIRILGALLRELPLILDHKAYDHSDSQSLWIGVSRPSGPKTPKKSKKRSFQALPARSVKKVSKRVPKHPKKSQKRVNMKTVTSLN